MPRNELATKLKSFDSANLMTWLAWIIAFAASIVAAAFFAYFHSFGDLGLSNRQDIWGQFGDFVGGTVNPILSFLSLIALVLTVTLQSRQLTIAKEELENSKQELAATREELKRSTDAQRQTAKALQEQAKHAEISARLSALRAALDVTSESLRQATSDAGFGSSPALRINLLTRKDALAAEIIKITEHLFREVSDEP